MREFKNRALHSGSKHGPIVTNPKQAIAIAYKVSGKDQDGDSDAPSIASLHTARGSRRLK